MVSSDSRPYFQRATGQSGGCTTRQLEAGDVSDDVKQWLQKFDCQGEDALACMRDVPIKRLVDGELDSARPFAPIVDKDFLVGQPRDLFRAQKAAKVPYILGSNRDEGSLFTSDFQGIDNEADFNPRTATRATRFNSTGPASPSWATPTWQDSSLGARSVFKTTSV
jgi:para-nitrobenzyl esterase